MGRIEVFLSLDLLDLDHSVSIAKKAVKAGFSEIEVGTPLIKSEGIRSVERIREEFGSRVKIFADMKTMDTGYLEAGMAFDAGADIASVMAVAPTQTIKEALRRAEEGGKEILVDTLGLGPDLTRVRELVDIGVHRICIHRGIDEGIFSEYELLDRMRELGVKLGVAGGIDETTISILAKKVDFVMVGRAITKSDNPEEAAKRILAAASV